MFLPAGRRTACVEETQVAEGDGGEAVGIGAGFGDDGVLRPIEIDLAEPAAFGDESCEGGGRLVDDFRLVGGGDRRC